MNTFFKLFSRLERHAIILRSIASVFLVIGGIGWLGDILITNRKSPFIGSETELPLGRLEGIVVDSQGNIYCGSQSYGRIQQYDAQGNFTRGWFIKTAGGAFRMQINKEDQLLVATARTDLFATFDQDGDMVDLQTNLPGIYQEFGLVSQSRFESSNGDTYVIENSFFFPHVVRISFDGKQSTIITTSWYKWLFMTPFPAYLFAGLGFIISVLTNKRTIHYWRS